MQIAFPIADEVLQPQQWGVFPASPTTRFDKIDETPADTHDSDGTYIFAPNPNFQISQVKMAPLLDPRDSDLSLLNHRIVWWSKRVGAIEGARLRIELLQGQTDIIAHRDGLSGLSDPYLKNTPFVLTKDEAASITDYTDLQIKLTAWSTNLVGEIRVTQLYLEFPDAELRPRPAAGRIKVMPQPMVLDPGDKILLPGPGEIKVISQAPTLDFPRILTPNAITIKIKPQMIELKFSLKVAPGAKTVNVSPQEIVIALGPTILVPFPQLQPRLGGQPINIELEGLVTPGAGDIRVAPLSPTVKLGPITATPAPGDIRVAPQSLALNVPLDMSPDAGGIVVAPQPPSIDYITLTPNAIVIVVRLLRHKISVPPTVPRRVPQVPPGHIREPIFRRRRRLPIRPPVFRGRFLHDARGLTRVYGPVEYRFYRRDGAPPEELDLPYATSAVLPATPATTFPDGDWYISMSLFNGVIDSGFLPLGPNGERYVRVRVVASAEVALPPLGPTNWALRVLAAGVVQVEAVYLDLNTPLRATEWALAFTTDGSDPVADSPDVTAPIAAGQAITLKHALPAQADATVVKVRLQTRRLSTVYSEESYVLTATADAVGEVVVLGLERWTGRLPENFTGRAGRLPQ